MRFVAPESKQYTLKNGKDWIVVKKELSVGEDRRYRTRGMRGMSGMAAADEKKGVERDIKIDIEWDVLSIARVEAYLVDWSEKRAVTREAIEALAKEDFEEIDQIIQDHIKAMDEEKKALTSSSTSSSTSP